MNITYLSIPSGQRVYRTLKELIGARLEPGDSVLLRDFSEILPPDTLSTEKARGKWQLLHYELSDGQKGKLIAVNDVAGDKGSGAVPPEFEVPLDLGGWYAVWVGVPNLDLKPVLSFNYTAVDIALDDEPFGGIGPEFGRRRGKLMGPTEVEVMCFWRCVRLDGRRIRIRAPFGTYSSQPWGLVRSIISSLRLVKLDEEQVKAYLEDISNKAHKRVLLYADGFSEYFCAGEPGKGIDLWYPETFGYSDHRIYLLQTPSTGVANWPSRVTNLVGEGLSEEDWKSQHRGEKRCCDYIKWASEHGQEGMRIGPAAFRKAGWEFHASLRMNIFQSGDFIYGKFADKVFNGNWWFEHPEARKQPIPGDESTTGRTPSWVRRYQLDYALPAVRRFIKDILSELASEYDVDGINLDFTRWPPVADHRRHDSSVLTSFIAEVRRELDGIEKARGRKLAMSATMVEGAHARDENDKMLTLEEQKMDLEAWLATGALDFICVQTWRHSRYIDLAHRYGVPYYCHIDMQPLDLPGGSQDSSEPEWRDHDDPVPGEELLEQPPVGNVLDPLEIYGEALKQYRAGADGVCFLNVAGRSLGRLGHVDELAERVAKGMIWGQEIGPSIRIRWQHDAKVTPHIP